MSRLTNASHAAGAAKVAPIRWAVRGADERLFESCRVLTSAALTNCCEFHFITPARLLSSRHTYERDRSRFGTARGGTVNAICRRQSLSCSC
jgi:hypothetical protein